MDEVVSLSQAEKQQLLDEYTIGRFKQFRKIEEFARDVRQCVIKSGGQGDCVSVSKAISSLMQKEGVEHRVISMESGRYVENNEEIPHAWIELTDPSVPVVDDAIIIDGTAEQFISCQKDVHILFKSNEFVESHYL